MSEWFNEHPKIVVGVTVVSVLVGVVVIGGRLTGQKGSKLGEYEKEWLYNLETGELFIAKIGEIEPTLTPVEGEPAIARACVLSYVYEPNESECFIAFLDVQDPEAAKYNSADEQGKVDSTERWGRGKLIRRVGDQKWVPANSRLGRAILEDAFRPDGNGERPSYFRPK